MHIGVIDLADQGWTGGKMYSEVLATSLKRASGNGSVYFLSASAATSDLPEVVDLATCSDLPFEVPFRRAFGKKRRKKPLRGENRVLGALRLRRPADPLWVARENGIDVVLPVSVPPSATHRSYPALVGWIPDFQYLHMPELFGEQASRSRHLSYKRIASQCSLVMLSSEAVRRDYLSVFPEFAHKVRVHPFPSRYSFSRPTADPDLVKDKYNLPQKYILCANQLWAHKNHSMVLDALARLKQSGRRGTKIVITGLPLDVRSPVNEPTSAALQKIAQYGLSDEVCMLGMVSRPDLEALMRGSAGFLQPSKSEGWSTSVEDAKALGKPLLCSALPVHREQAPDARFFDLDATSMAECIWGFWESGDEDSSLDLTGEAAALSHAQERGTAHGRGLTELCLEAQSSR